jgi:hypothetical protein
MPEEDIVSGVTDGLTDGLTDALPTASCNIDLNINNLTGILQSNLGTILNLNLGTPPGLAAVQGAIQGAFAGVEGFLTDAISSVLPDISLTDELGKLSKATGLDAAAGKIGEIAEDFQDATGLEGFVDLNLTDLSKSTFSLGTSFDPCSTALPNLFKSATGDVFSKPSILPNFGSPDLGERNTKKQPITDDVQKAKKENKFISGFVSAGLSAGVGSLLGGGNTSFQGFLQLQQTSLLNNIVPSKSGMDNILRKTATGETVVETTSDVVSRKKETSSLLSEETETVTEIPFIETVTESEDTSTDWASEEYRLKRREALGNFKAESGLSGGKLLSEFNKKIRDGGLII